jgi:hypothetical protein
MAQFWLMEGGRGDLNGDGICNLEDFMLVVDMADGMTHDGYEYKYGDFYDSYGENNILLYGNTAIIDCGVLGPIPGIDCTSVLISRIKYFHFLELYPHLGHSFYGGGYYDCPCPGIYGNSPYCGGTISYRTYNHFMNVQSYENTPIDEYFYRFYDFYNDGEESIIEELLLYSFLQNNTFTINMIGKEQFELIIDDEILFTFTAEQGMNRDSGFSEVVLFFYPEWREDGHFNNYIYPHTQTSITMFNGFQSTFRVHSYRELLELINKKEPFVIKWSQENGKNGYYAQEFYYPGHTIGPITPSYLQQALPDVYQYMEDNDLDEYTYYPLGTRLYVDKDAPGTQDGSSWENAFHFLQDALKAAQEGDVICVAEGVYKPDEGSGMTPGDREATFQLKNGVIIRGGYAGYGETDPDKHYKTEYPTTLSGDFNDDDIYPPGYSDFSHHIENCYHVVTGSDTDRSAILDSVRIRGGYADSTTVPHGYGGGIYNDHGSPTLISCSINRSFALSAGGGICNNNDSNPKIINCRIAANTSNNFGGGMTAYRSNPYLIDCDFSLNRAINGAGLDCSNSTIELNDCSFSRNISQNAGGGLFLYDATIRAINSRFEENEAGIGGGIYCSNGSDVNIITYDFINNIASDLACSVFSLAHPDSSDIRFEGYDNGKVPSILNDDGSTIVYE